MNPEELTARTALGLLFALFALGWAPGFVLGRLLGRTRPGELAGRGALELALSPIVATGAIVLLALVGISFHLAVQITAQVAVMGAVWFLYNDWRQRAQLVPERVKNTGLRGVTWLITLTIPLVAAMNGDNPWLRWRADGRFHIGVTAEILRGGIPPTDPFFAGLPLQYMWFFHAWLAALKVISGAPTSWLMVYTNLLALVAFLGLSAAIARALGRGPTGIFITALVVMFGMGGLSWLLIPVKMLGAFTGKVRGMEEIRGLFHLWPMTIEKSLGLVSAGYDQPYLLRKFLVGTAMSLALAASLLYLTLVLMTFRESVSRRRLAPLLALAAAGAIILHPMVGIPIVVVTAVAAIGGWLLLKPPRVEQTPVTKGAAVTVAVSSFVGALLALPYLRLVTAGKAGEPGLPIDIWPPKILWLLVGSLGLSIPALIGLFGRDGLARAKRPGSPLNPEPFDRPMELWLVLWGFLLAGFALFVRFPLERENIDKPTLLMHLAVAFVGGGAMARAWTNSAMGRKAVIAAWLIALTVPTTLFMTLTYALERDPRTYRPDEKEALTWIRATSPENSIVFDSQDRDRPGVEIPRRMFWSHEQFAATHEYPKPEMDRRRAVRDALYSLGGPDAATIRTLHQIGAPIYVIVRAGAAMPGHSGEPSGQDDTTGSFEDGAFDPLYKRPEFECLFDRDDCRVYRLRLDVAPGQGPP